MLKRKMLLKLRDWKKEQGHKSLLIRGMRQCGKTYIVNQFGQETYKYVVNLNFIEHPEYKSIFEGALEVDELIKRISLVLPEARFEKGDTLIFLDEIQECANARASLKFWTADGRFDVIATGSLLGLNYKDELSFPVGYVKTLNMYSLDFEEFLWAKGYDEDALNNLKELFVRGEEIPQAIHKKMMDNVKEYMLVGGMPEAVNTFIQSSNFALVHEVQAGLINDYLDDIARYAPSADKVKARKCFLSIPAQLAKKNTKFQRLLAHS